MDKLYCISGLGADHRLFAHIAVPGYELVDVPWLPFPRTDTMATYAMKLAATMPDDAPIIGLSLGGMLATEIAKRSPQRRVVIISSAKVRAELGYALPGLPMLSQLLPEFCFARPEMLHLLRRKSQS